MLRPAQLLKFGFSKAPSGTRYRAPFEHPLSPFKNPGLKIPAGGQRAAVLFPGLTFPPPLGARWALGAVPPSPAFPFIRTLRIIPSDESSETILRWHGAMQGLLGKLFRVTVSGKKPCRFPLSFAMRRGRKQPLNC